jgi:hypothetical protein
MQCSQKICRRYGRLHPQALVRANFDKLIAKGDTPEAVLAKLERRFGPGDLQLDDEDYAPSSLRITDLFPEKKSGWVW